MCIYFTFRSSNFFFFYCIFSRRVYIHFLSLTFSRPLSHFLYFYFCLRVSWVYAWEKSTNLHKTQSTFFLRYCENNDIFKPFWKVYVHYLMPKPISPFPCCPFSLFHDHTFFIFIYIYTFTVLTFYLFTLSLCIFFVRVFFRYYFVPFALSLYSYVTFFSFFIHSLFFLFCIELFLFVCSLYVKLNPSLVSFYALKKMLFFNIYFFIYLFCL